MLVCCFGWEEYICNMRIFVRVKPRAREEKIERIDNEHFIIAVKEVPDKGLANKAVIKSLAKYLAVSKTQVSLVSGASSRRKVIEINK